MSEGEGRPADRPAIGQWGKTEVPPGARRKIRLEAGESYTGVTVRMPLLVWRGEADGPTLFLTAAVHGDEINGTGTLREMINHPPFQLRRGSLIVVPVVNIMGFERHSRYMPDRRDLNRSFPGSPQGSLTSRLAHLVFREIVARSDYGIDLHTASVRRTNYPNVRADMGVSGCERLARAFGCDVVVDNRGPEGSLRRAATDAGCPTMILEAGEVWKAEPTYVQLALRGITNVLKHLGMVEGSPVKARHQSVVRATKWVRAGTGGFLEFHVRPGETVNQGQLLATNTGLLGAEQESIAAPETGLVLGMTTMPSVAPGDPVLHIAVQGKRELRRLEKHRAELPHDSLDARVRTDLATNLHVTKPEGGGRGG